MGFKKVRGHAVKATAGICQISGWTSLAPSVPLFLWMDEFAAPSHFDVYFLDVRVFLVVHGFLWFMLWRDWGCSSRSCGGGLLVMMASLGAQAVGAQTPERVVFTAH